MNGRSERFVGELVAGPEVFVATKMGRRAEQRRENYNPLTSDQLDGVRDVYDRLIRQHVHDRW